MKADSAVSILASGGRTQDQFDDHIRYEGYDSGGQIQILSDGRGIFTAASCSAVAGTVDATTLHQAKEMLRCCSLSVSVPF